MTDYLEVAKEWLDALEDLNATLLDPRNVNVGFNRAKGEALQSYILHLEGLVALQADAADAMLEEARLGVLTLSTAATMQRAISAYAETVAKYKAALTEPLRREGAMLVDWFKKDNNCTCETCWSCAGKGAAVLSKTQATAQAYEQEVEQRGAVKALEDAALKWLPNMRRSDFESSMGKSVHNMAVDDCVKHVLSMAESLRATSKKAGT